MDNRRLKTFLQVIKSHHLDGFIVTNPINIFYLSEFRGISQTERESILIFCPSPVFLTASLYQNEAGKVAGKNLKVKIVPQSYLIHQKAASLLKNCRRIGFEENNLTFHEYQYFRKALGDKLAPKNNLIENLRVTKTEDEIKKIEKAQIISQKAFEKLLKTVKIGQTEDEIAEKLAQVIKSLGGQDLAFESIIASGPNSGIPHHVTGRRKIKKGDILLFDFGAKYQNYCADLSRTIFLGRAGDRQRNIFNHVLTTQQKAIAKIESGTKSPDAYHAALDHFKKHKLNKYFIHGLGHGIGLEVHEAPYLRPFDSAQGHGLKPKTTDEEILTEGMVFSVEPGLYFSWGGIRIEDLVTIANGKAKVLGKTVTEIIEI